MSVQQTLERAVIGLALTGDPRVALDLDRVRPGHFADPRHGAVWGLIRAQEPALSQVAAFLVYSGFLPGSRA